MKSVDMPAPMCYQMLVSGFVNAGIPLSIFQATELKSVFKNKIGPVPSTERLYGILEDSIVKKMENDVRF